MKMFTGDEENIPRALQFWPDGLHHTLHPCRIPAKKRSLNRFRHLLENPYRLQTFHYRVATRYALTITPMVASIAAARTGINDEGFTASPASKRRLKRACLIAA